MLANLVGALPNFSTFPFSAPASPNTMLIYCVVSDKSFAIFPKYTAAVSYLQETALLWGEGASKKGIESSLDNSKNT